MADPVIGQRYRVRADARESWQPFRKNGATMVVTRLGATMVYGSGPSPGGADYKDCAWMSLNDFFNVYEPVDDPSELINEEW